MRLFDLPTGETVDLDEVSGVGPLFENKNDSEFNCYEVYARSGNSYNVFEKDIPRADFLIEWKGA